MKMNDNYSEALKLYKENKLNEAKAVLENDINISENITSIYLLGVIESTTRNYSKAVYYYDKVLEEDPTHFEAKYNKALSLHKNGELDKALEMYEEVLKQNPNFDDALNNIAFIHKVRNNFFEAGKYILKMVENNKNSYNLESNIQEIKPTLDDEDFKRAVELSQKGENKEALSLLEDLLIKYPKRFEVLHTIASIHFLSNEYSNAIKYFEIMQTSKDHAEVGFYGAALCFQRLKELNKAIDNYFQAISIKPDFQDALNNLGLIYYGDKNFELAEKYYQQSLKANNKHFNTIINLGALRTQQDRYDEAMELFDIAKDYANASENKTALAVIFGNVGYCRLRERKLNEAISYFDKAIDFDNENVLAHYNKGEALLTQGNFKDGWKEYTWRVHRAEFGNRKFFKPILPDSDLRNKRIYVYGEQGVGDSIQFIRYLKYLKKLNCYILFECDKNLFDLLGSTKLIDEFVVKESTEKPSKEYDFDVPLLDLPYLFETDETNIPNEVPYLFADEEKKNYWKDHINADNKLKVGIVWQGSLQHPNDKNRSVKLNQLSFLFDDKDLQLYSLQKGDPENQINQFKDSIINLDDFGIKGFSDTAAIIEHLDLVIAVDTSVAHLAGAMGKEIWVLIPYNADWRWLENRSDSPWYPTMKLFRQKKIQEWKPIFESVNEEIQQKIMNLKKEKSTNNYDKYQKIDSFLNKISSDIYPENPSKVHTDITESVIKNLSGSKVLVKGTKVLDVGCGQAVALKLFKEIGCDAVGITLGQDDYDYCKSNGYNVHLMDMSFLDFENNSFDFLWVRHALEHSIFPYFTLSEFNRVLKPNGLMYVEVPAPDTDAHHETNPNHYSVLSKSMWNSLLQRSGFEKLQSESISLTLPNNYTDEYFTFIYKKKEDKPNLKTEKKLTLALTKGDNFGWGVCSRYLNTELSKKISIENLNVENADDEKKVPGKVFHALTNQSFFPLHKVRGDENYGYTFFENELNNDSIENAKKYIKVFGGSTWNVEKMNEKGIMNTGVLIQGVDHSLFYPGKKEKLQDKFVIFSGGKFEFRKGQDIVIKAFKELHKKYKDMILVNAWFNMWPQTMDLMNMSKHIKYEYKGNDWVEVINNIFRINDVDLSQVITLPVIDNKDFREIYLNTDLGLFPNRCEGGTNLVLMEYMACGKPVAAAYNSGQKDVLTDQNSIMIEGMKEINLFDKENTHVARWFDPDLDEVIAKIEMAYHNRTELERVGNSAGNSMLNYSWQNSAESLIAQIF